MIIQCNNGEQKQCNKNSLKIKAKTKYTYVRHRYTGWAISRLTPVRDLNAFLSSDLWPILYYFEGSTALADWSNIVIM
jgi:hypothetical protein